MAATFQLNIVTHDATVFSGPVESLVVPGVMGSLGILAHHAPLLTSLKQGKVVIRQGAMEQLAFTIPGGILEVKHNEAVILADDAVPA